MNPDQWLEENTFYCEAYRARITPAQCEINRARDNQPGTPTMAPTGITACNGCDWERMQKPDVGSQTSEIREEKTEEIKKELKVRLERKKAENARRKTDLQPAPSYDDVYYRGLQALETIGMEEESVSKKNEKKKGICLECGEEKFIQGRGLCARCYSRLRNEGNLDKYPALPRGGDVRNKPKNEQAPDKAPVKAVNKYPEAQEQVHTFPGGPAKAMGPDVHSLTFMADLEAAQIFPPQQLQAGPCLCIDFSQVPDGEKLLEDLEQSARENFRTPEMHAAWVISKGLGTWE